MPGYNGDMGFRAFDRDEGIKQGDKIADYVFEKMLMPHKPPLASNFSK